MFAYALRRLAAFVPVLAGVATLTFVVLHVLPGDPVLAMVGERYDAATLERLRAEMHLDDPLPVRYARYMAGLARLDLGRSYVTGEPVWEALRERFPWTLRLAAAAMAVSVVVGIGAGVVAAWRWRSLVDVMTVSVTVVGVSMPVFWVGVLLVWLFAVRLHWLPASGTGDWRHLVLPAVTLAQASTAFVARITRSALLEESGELYVRAARARGASRARALLRHALRAALLPVVTVIGADFGSFLSGAVLTESIFAWPGLGRYTLEAILQRDLPAIQGAVLTMAVVFLTINLAVDLLYARIDPRVRPGGMRHG